MKLINDKDNPGLVGVIDSPNDVEEVKRMVDNLNQDLRDSSFEKYQYKSIRRGNKLYIERR